MNLSMLPADSAHRVDRTAGAQPNDARMETIDPAAEALAVGAVLFKAHDAARHLEHLLELEAADPRVAELMRDAKRIRKSIGALLVDVAIESSTEPTPKEV